MLTSASLGFVVVTTGSYSMNLGDADAKRLTLLGQFYDPNSNAFLEAAGVQPGDRVVDLGCGHGGVTDRIAARVGDEGVVYAVDAAREQLHIARANLAHRSNVRFVHARIEDDPLSGEKVDWVFSRFLLMHVEDLGAALTAMTDMLTDCGALLLEIADIGSLQFIPTDKAADLWRPWWYALGQTRGLAFDVADRIGEALSDAGLVIQRRDRYQPIAATTEAKLVHALGFEQCAPAYISEIGVPAEQIETHRRYLERVLDDEDVTVKLFENTQYLARRVHQG
jgi:ubiquinone/menaquinone biosynthesis C-methylase UbiE